MPREISAGAVVFHRAGSKTEYLILQHDDNYWNFPKGQVDKGETLEETVCREIKEETGLTDIKLIDGFKATDKYFYKRNGQGIFKIVVFLLAEAKSKKVKISFEHIGFVWLPYKKALTRLTYKNTKMILQKAHQFLIAKVND